MFWPVVISQIKSARQGYDKTFSIPGRSEALDQHGTVTVVAVVQNVDPSADGRKHIVHLHDDTGFCVGECFADEHAHEDLVMLVEKYVRVQARLSAWRNNGTVTLDVKAIRPIASSNEVYYHMAEVMVAAMYNQDKIKGFQPAPGPDAPIVADMEPVIALEPAENVPNASAQKVPESVASQTQVVERQLPERAALQSTTPERLFAIPTSTTPSMHEQPTMEEPMDISDDNTPTEVDNEDEVESVTDEDSADGIAEPPRTSKAANRARSTHYAPRSLSTTYRSTRPRASAGDTRTMSELEHSRASSSSSISSNARGAPKPPSTEERFQAPTRSVAPVAGPSRLPYSRDPPAHPRPFLSTSLRSPPSASSTSTATRVRQSPSALSPQRDPFAGWTSRQRKMLLQVYALQGMSPHGVHISALVGSGHVDCRDGECGECAFEWLVEEAFIYETINKHYQVNDEFEVPKPL